MIATQENPIPERKRMEKFLPWYVAGRLNQVDRLQLEDYLRRNPDFARSVERVRIEHDELVGLYETMGAPRGGALHRLMATIGADGGTPALEARPRGLRRLSAWFQDLTPRQLAFAATVTLGVFAAQAVAIAVLATKGSPLRQQSVATAPVDTRAQPRITAQPSQAPAVTVASERAATVTGGSYLVIAFQESAKQAEMNDLLKRFGASIIEGPVEGKYRLRLLDQNAARGVTAHSPPRDLGEVAAQLRALPAIVKQVEVLK